MVGRGVPSSHHQTLLTALHSHNSPEVLQTLVQLHDELVLAQDDAFAAFPVDQYIPTLIDVLNQSTDPETALLSIKSVNQILDAVPNAAHLMTVCGGVALLCSKLSNFEYIDVAESAIKCLEKVVHEQSTEILKENALTALVTVVEVLEAPTQKLVFVIVCGLAKVVSGAEAFVQYVAPALPALAGFLQFRGTEFIQMNEHALDFFLALMSSVERMDSTQAKTCVELTADPELLRTVLNLANTVPSLAGGVLRLLKSICRFSVPTLSCFLSMDAGTFISGYFEGEETLLQDALNLTTGMLPGSHEKEALALYEARPDFARQIGMALLTKVLRAYDSAASKALKRVCVDIVDKLMARSRPETIKELISPRDVARFLRELIDTKEINSVKTALRMTLEMIEKLPDEMAIWLTREGVLDKIKQLTKEEVVGELIETESQKPQWRRGNRNYLPSRPGLGPDPHTMEQLISQMRQRTVRINRSQAQIEDHPPPPVTRTRSSDPVQDLKTELQRLVSKALSKSKDFDQADGIMQKLRHLAEEFSGKTEGREKELITILMEVLVSPEDITSHELCASGVLVSLWKWLTGNASISDSMTETELSLSRTHLSYFLACFLQEGKDGELHMSVFVRKLVAVLRYSQQFPIVLHEAGHFGGHFGLRALTQRAYITLVFTPELNPHLEGPELLEKTELFARMPTLSIALEQYQTFDSVRDALSKLRTPDDFSRFGSMFHRSFTEIRGMSRDRLAASRLHRHYGDRALFQEDLLRQLQEGMDPGDVLERMQRLEAEEMDEEDSEMMEEEDPELVRPMDRKDSSIGVMLVAKLFYSSKEVVKGTTIFELATRTGQDISESLTVNFAYFHKEIDPLETSEFVGNRGNVLRKLISETKSVGLEPDKTVYVPLRLLKLLNALNRHMNSVVSPGSLLFPECRVNMVHTVIPPQTFYCSKLTALLSKQLQDLTAMTGGVAADWVKDLTRRSSFLFPFPLRVQLLKSWGLGPLKSLSYFSQKLKNSPESFQVRVQRQKVCIPRDRILESAIKVMRDRSLIQFGSLEFDFQNEEGTGKGPTLEFYSLTSRAIRQLDIWRNTGEEVGLFPSPSGPYNSEELFEFIGRFVAKAVMDDKLLDLPLSPCFWKLVFGYPLVLTDILDVDRQLGETLVDFQAILNRKFMGESDLTFRGVEISELMLTFTLPGYEEIELKPSGKSTIVTLETLEEYVHLVADQTLMQTQAAQAFRRGLEVLVSVEKLKMFTAEELECLICGEQDEDWRLETLNTAVVAAHGYTKSSQTFQHVLLIISELPSDYRKLFLQFVTGSPRLPLGGFAGLSPPLTIVKKDPDVPGSAPDAYLPSVMTCQNYLKMPSYSSFEVLKKQLTYAFTEGHESFHLS